MELTKLYSRTSTGAVQQWTIEVEGDKYRTHFGQTDGKQQETLWTVCKPKNEGRSNATTAEEQALKDAQALWKKKKESGCFENIADIDTVGFTEPMLAKKYEDFHQKISFPVYSQLKLDGIRCIARRDGLWSRNGKRIVSCPHIENALKKVFDEFPDLKLDGELYCDKYSNDFNAICSLVKKTKPTPHDLNESAKSIEYWIYDTVDTTKTFRQRWNDVMEVIDLANSEFLKEVETEFVQQRYVLDELYGKYTNEGYEGQMVRTNDLYENKRSKNLLKRKEFQDKEYTILDIIEGDGNRAGGAGAMVFENEQGVRFNSNIKGTREYCTQLLREKDSVIGKQATVKFFNLTPDSLVPRFPFVIGIRDVDGIW
jgi:DNA ligase-1